MHSHICLLSVAPTWLDDLVEIQILLLYHLPTYLPTYLPTMCIDDFDLLVWVGWRQGKANFTQLLPTLGTKKPNIAIKLDVFYI